MAKRTADKRVLVTISTKPRKDSDYTLLHYMEKAEAPNTEAMRYFGAGRFNVDPSAVTVEVGKLNKPRRWTAPRTTVSGYDWKPRAICYAKWLAKRDGIELPTTGKIRLDWSGVYSKTRKASNGYGVYERRISAVLWGHEKQNFNTRKDGRQGAYTHTSFETEFRFELPNWDFVVDPIEDMDAQIALAS